MDQQKTIDAPSREKYTLYIFVRKDISLAQQMVQLGHAAAEAGKHFYDDAEHGIASLVALAVEDKAGLHRAERILNARGLRTVLFHEPDFGMGDSALGAEPVTQEQRKLFRQWSLWRPTASDFQLTQARAQEVA